MKPLNFLEALALAPDATHRESFNGYIYECYENEIPDFVDSELERLYRSRFSSLAHFNIHGGIENASVYVARNSSKALSVLLYRTVGREVEVINQCITLAEWEISCFTEFIFRNLPNVDAVRFSAIEVKTRSLPFPVQIYQCNEDFVLNLPSSVEAYFSCLGKSTRSYINRYKNKAKRNHPSFTFEAYSGTDIKESDVGAIFEMNRSRMAERGYEFGYSEDYPTRTLPLLREIGLLCLVRIEGQICAGTIQYCVGGEYFLEVISHKTEYNDIGLGTLCCYLSICECIRREGKAYHFLWGRYDYKTRLGGVARPLSNVVVYRSRIRLLVHFLPALKRAVKGNMYRSKQGIKTALANNQSIARFISSPFGRFARSQVKNPAKVY